MHFFFFILISSKVFYCSFLNKPLIMNSPPPTEDSFVDIHVSVIILAFLVKSVVLIESCDSNY